MKDYLIKQPLALKVSEERRIYIKPEVYKASVIQQFMAKAHDSCVRCQYAKMDTDRSVMYMEDVHRLRCTAKKCEEAGYDQKGPLTTFKPMSEEDIKDLVAHLDSVAKEAHAANFTNEPTIDGYQPFGGRYIQPEPPKNNDIPSVEGAGAW